MVLSAAVLQGQEKRDSLKEKAIEEVVLVNVGYGTQKKSVVTGSHGRKIFLPTFLFFLLWRWSDLTGWLSII